MATKKPPVEGKVIKLNWASADELPTLYANHMLVTHGESEFVLIFGSLVPPIATSPEELPSELTIQPVAKIVMTPQVMQKVMDALNKNFERFEVIGKEGQDDS